MGTNGLCWCMGNQGAFYIPKLDLGLDSGTNKIERWNWGLGSEIWASTLRFGPQEQDLSFKAGNRAKSWYQNLKLQGFELQA